MSKTSSSGSPIAASQFYITLPWSPQIYFTVRGAENFHIYLWILKDLSWSQNWVVCGWLFGLSAISWCGILVYHAFESRCYFEMYMLVAMIMWLVANFVWMAGEVFHDDDDTVRPESSKIMIAALCWLGLYYLFLKPFKLLPMDVAMTKKYAEADLHPRFSYFENWREYEHAHMLCWLGKDLAWDTTTQSLWIICLIPTFLIAFDFIWVTWQSKRMAIDCAHYVAQLIWVVGNGVWALGEVFTIPGNDDDSPPHSMWRGSKTATTKCRWWSSIILAAALVPIVCLYMVWLPLTCMGRIKAAEIPENNQILSTQPQSDMKIDGILGSVTPPVAIIQRQQEVNGGSSSETSEL